jgi:hypothetical protein
MDSYSELEKIRAVLDLARAEINRQEPDLALAHLREIQHDTDQFEGTVPWADFSLLIAEAFCAKRDEAAATFLEDAEERIQKITNPPPELQLRLWERCGDFHGSVSRRLSKAREYYAHAKVLALDLGVPELVARVELKIIRIDLHIDRDPAEENFRTLRRVGKQGNFTSKQQLAAWHIHYGNTAGTTKGLRFARGLSKAGDDYFRSLLESVRQGPS